MTPPQLADPPRDNSLRGGTTARTLGTFLLERPLWLVVVTVVALFHRVISGRETLFLRDLFTYFLPQKQVLLTLLEAGEFPLWNPFIQGGMSYLPNLANAVLFPTTAFYLVLPALLAFNLTVVAALLTAISGTYVLARILGFDRWPAGVAAAVVGFSGPVLSLGNLINHLNGFSLVPWLLLLWHVNVTEGRTAFRTAAFLVGIVQVLAGSPEASVLAFGTLLVWTTALPANLHVRARRVASSLLLTGMVGLGCAIQLLPTAEIVRGSPRGFGLQFLNLTQWSLYPRRLLELIFPGLIGHLDGLGPEFWGGALVDQGSPYLMSIYFGVTAVGLAFAGATVRHQLPDGLRRVLAGMAVAGVTLALGRHLPAAEAMYSILPFTELARYPSKILLVAIMPLALLAAAGMTALLETTRQARFAAPAGLMILTAIAWLLHLTAPEEVTQALVGSVRPEALNGVRAAMAHSLAFAAALFLLSVVKPGPRRWLQPAFFLLVLFDLGMGGYRVNPSAPMAMVSSEPESVTLLAKHLGDGRLYRTEIPDEFVLHAPSDHAAWRMRWVVGLLGSWSPGLYGIPATLDDDLLQLTPLHLMRLKYAAENLGWSERAPLLGAAGVAVILAEGDNVEHSDEGPLVKISDVTNRSDQRWAYYKNRLAAPPARLVTSWQGCEDDDEVLSGMASAGYDPRAVSVIVGVESGPSKSTAGNRVEILATSNHRRRFRVTAAVDGYLVLTVPYTPGWHVKVDGEPAVIRRADLAFQAVAIPAGVHEVEHWYLPTSFLVGTALSMMTLMVVVGTWRRRWWFDGNEAPPGSPTPQPHRDDGT